MCVNVIVFGVSGFVNCKILMIVVFGFVVYMVLLMEIGCLDIVVYLVGFNSGGVNMLLICLFVGFI